MGEASIQESITPAKGSDSNVAETSAASSNTSNSEVEVLNTSTDQSSHNGKSERRVQTSGENRSDVDPEALHELVTQHSDSIFRLAYSIVSDRALAEDITQDTLVKAWLALPSFRGDGSLKGWVLRIAHNTAISAIRARKAIVVDPIDLVDSNPTRSDLVEKKVEDSEAYGEFVEALDHLDELSRSILVLREVEGLSYEEISQMLKVPLPTVKTRLLRSRRRLGVALKGWQS